MKPPQSRKEVQRLTGRIAALNWFMAKIAERGLPFFKVLKEHIQKLQTLASPQPDEPLILYIFTTHTAISRALVQERDVLKGDKKTLQQVPIYFMFKALAVSKMYY
jgi:hypothetical protein